ncbi:uncharacterized protein LOC111029332 [Myzus persicae]|uniref:uncharacterized protein LOC111029332 n=1 Tax=Myzus persicae TaxID=13164 RepID=UPI000B932A28|nr:uncharacterized protein LOC111029332 [Myzus persicae]
MENVNKKNSPDLTSPIKMDKPDNKIIELLSPASQDLKLDLEDMEIVIRNDNSCLHELKPKALFNETNPPIVIEIISDQVKPYYDLGCKHSEYNIPSVSEPTQSETPTKNKIIPEEYEPTDRLVLDVLECNAPFTPEHEATQNEIPIINQLFPEEQAPNVRLQLDSSIVIDPEYINPKIVVETGRKKKHK